jgi:hypothetical protein
LGRPRGLFPSVKGDGSGAPLSPLDSGMSASGVAGATAAATAAVEAPLRLPLPRGRPRPRPALRGGGSGGRLSLVTMVLSTCERAWSQPEPASDMRARSSAVATETPSGVVVVSGAASVDAAACGGVAAAAGAAGGGGGRRAAAEEGCVGNGERLGGRMSVEERAESELSCEAVSPAFDMVGVGDGR